MKYIYFSILVLTVVVSGCNKEKDENFSDLIVGKWIGFNRIVHFVDGTSLNNLSTGICERQTEFTLSPNGDLKYSDFIEKEVNDGSIDFCELNTLTSENGTWELLPSDRLRFRLTNTLDSSEILIEPFEINLIDEDALEIRFNEFETSESFDGKEISYYSYQYFRVFIN